MKEDENPSAAAGSSSSAPEAEAEREESCLTIWKLSYPQTGERGGEKAFHSCGICNVLRQPPPWQNLASAGPHLLTGSRNPTFGEREHKIKTQDSLNTERQIRG